MKFEHCNHLGDLELEKKETNGMRLYNLPDGQWVPSITSVTSFYNRQIFIDWRKRPLSEEKINYASKDVKYLPDLYLKITKKIELETNLNISIKHKKLLDIDAFKRKPERAWKKLKINETEKYEIRKLRELCFLREKIAKKVNVPVKRIISDQQIR